MSLPYLPPTGHSPAAQPEVRTTSAVDQLSTFLGVHPWAEAQREALVRFALHLDTTGVGTGTGTPASDGPVTALEGLLHAATDDIDELTGLASRPYFLHRLGEALAEDARRSMQSALLIVDVGDHEDMPGQEHYSPQLMAAAAEVLREGTRRQDLPARLSEREFGVLLTGLPRHDDAMAVAQRVVRSLDKSINVDGHPVQLQTSIGIAVAAPGQSTSAELLRDADHALHLAKTDGNGSRRHIVFERQMREARTRRQELDVQLNGALGRGELSLVYQPQIDLNNGQIRGMEALMRWTDPVRGPISPAEFIPAAEESGLIVTLGLWSLQEACAQTQLWAAALGGDVAIPVSVNLSGRQLRHASLLADVAAVIEGTHVLPGQLTLELTETYLMQGSEAALEKLRDLKSIGVGLAIDDFGTGYSSLAYLRDFPFDECKVDKSFVQGLGTDPQAEVLTSTIVLLGEKLGLDIIAEGIETPQQLAFLRAERCPVGQGFLFARPMAPEQCLEWLAGRVADLPRRTALALAPRRSV